MKIAPMTGKHFAAIPQAMQDIRQWVLWRLMLPVKPGEKPKKVPWSVYNKAAKSTDPTTWHDFECVVMRYREGYHAGLGFVFAKGGGYGGCDLDGCRDPESGIIDQWAWVYIDKFRGYTEISPSGTGVKIFFRTSKASATGMNRKLDLPAKYGKTPGVELYTQRRYFAVTGQVVRGYEG